jgi:coatomer protein complex subunit epsilon
VYKARSHIALGNSSSVASLVPADSENVALKAVLALARFVGASEGDKDEALEPLRDLCVEIEGDDVEGDVRDKDTVRVLAGTAFAQAGEVEEALETLGAGGKTENLEA